MASNPDPREIGIPAITGVNRFTSTQQMSIINNNPGPDRFYCLINIGPIDVLARQGGQHNFIVSKNGGHTFHLVRKEDQLVVRQPDNVQGTYDLFAIEFLAARV